MGRLEGKKALITGGGSGIGGAIAELYVREGANVVITGRRENVLQEKVASLPEGRAAYVQGDISIPADAERMVKEAVAFGGGIDVLVNNAGIDKSGYAHELDLAIWNEVLATNLTGAFHMIRYTLPVMMEKGKGSIINIASLAGLRSIPAMTAYSTSKAGMIGMSNSIAFDYGPHGIRSNVICPGATATNMLADSDGIASGGLETLTKFLPIARAAAPEEMAWAAVFLASDESLYLTGQTIAIEGGACTVDPCGAAHLSTNGGGWHH